jgi:two-component system response regulator RegA
MQEHVLIIENHEMTRQGLCSLFEKVGVNVRSTRSIRSALKALAQLPSVVVLDLALSDGSGIEVLKAIRDTKMNARVATISANSDAPSSSWISTYMPDAVFGKPFDFDDFSNWLSHDENPEAANGRPV